MMATKIQGTSESIVSLLFKLEADWCLQLKHFYPSSLRNTMHEISTSTFRLTFLRKSFASIGGSGNFEQNISLKFNVKKKISKIFSVLKIRRLQQIMPSWQISDQGLEKNNPASIYMFKGNNKNTRKKKYVLSQQ